MKNIKGKIFVIEGSDCSGKETQTKMIVEKLKKLGHNVLLMSYPDYENETSTLVKMYLNGKFGDKVTCLDCFQASSMFAVDRLGSYLIKWKDFYENGGVVILDRFTSSNLVHQASKLSTVEEKKNYIEYWLDFENNKLKLPKPDKIFFLNMLPVYSNLLNEKRNNKITGESKKDLHENDLEFLQNSYNNAVYVSDLLNWETIDCIKDKEKDVMLSNILSIETINEKILSSILKELM